MTLSNQEKQKRFRLKEALSQKANELFNTWQLLRGLDISQNPLDVKNQLVKIVDLPSGWSEEEYRGALYKLSIFERTILSNNPHLLQNDILSGRSQENEDASSIRAGKEALSQAHKFVHAINSTLELGQGSNSDKAAIIMEVARNIGVSLLSEATKGNIPRSNATTTCLMLANPYLPKPQWLLEAIAQILREQLPNPESQRALAYMLLNPEKYPSYRL